MDLQSSIHTVTQEILSFSPILCSPIPPPMLSGKKNMSVYHYNLVTHFLSIDSENGKLSSNSGGISVDGSVSCSSSGNPNKSPLRSRKSSLSAVIDKLRLQHNPESDIFQNSGKKLYLTCTDYQFNFI